MTDNFLTLEPIGILRSPFKEKFGLPRQASLIKSCSATIELLKPYNSVDTIKGLEGFSDIWLIFGFHQNSAQRWKPLVRPPRLGGNQKIGVFASRSPFRPNSLGMSRVEIRKIIQCNNKASLEISCPDIVDGTPIYDIKPYIHYADSNSNALCGFAPDAPKPSLLVEFSHTALQVISEADPSDYPNLKQILIEVLEQDPRPSYKGKEEPKEYGFRLFDLNIIWQYEDGRANVRLIEKF